MTPPLGNPGKTPNSTSRSLSPSFSLYSTNYPSYTYFLLFPSLDDLPASRPHFFCCPLKCSYWHFNKRPRLMQLLAERDECPYCRGYIIKEVKTFQWLVTKIATLFISFFSILRFFFVQNEIHSWRFSMLVASGIISHSNYFRDSLNSVSISIPSENPLREIGFASVKN